MNLLLGSPLSPGYRRGGIPIANNRYVINLHEINSFFEYAQQAGQDPMTAIQVTTPEVHIRLRDRLRMRPRLLGVLVAVLFFWESLNPTLLPRAWAVQALLCGACTAIGYSIGASLAVILSWVRGAMGLPALDTRLGRRLGWAAWAVAMVIAWSGAGTLSQGILAAGVVAFGAIAQAMGATVANSQSVALGVIHVGYLLVGYTIMGALVVLLA